MSKVKTRRPRAEDDSRSGDLFSQPPSPPSPPTRGGEPPQRAPEFPSLSQFAERAYLAYAMSVVKGRALPSVEDGQKPVQRRILYTMREMGTRSDAPHKKSARVVGDALGRYHPHGDSATYDAMVRTVKGPDFPGGGQIISSREEIRRAYDTGRGSIRVRARWKVENLARGQYRVAIYELPPNTSAGRVLEEMRELVNPKAKAGKKALTPDQQNLKAATLALLETQRDDSDAEHPVRIVFEPRTGKVDAQELMDFLLAHTSMEANVPMNLVAIGGDGRPRQMGLGEVLREWATFRLDVLERRLKHRAGEVADRVHILEGRMIAFVHIDKVIKVIRNADEPKPELMEKFSLSERQAEDILEIRLRQLAKLEGIKIERELAELKKESGSLKKLLGSPAERRNLAAAEGRADAERFGDKRRTFIEEAERITVSMVETGTDEPGPGILSRNGFVRTRSGHGIDRAALTWKEGDAELAIIETRTVHPIVLFGANGRVFNARAADIPGGKGDGVPVSSLAETAGTTIVGMISSTPDTPVLLGTSGGNALRTKIEALVTRIRAGKQFVSVAEGESQVAPSIIAAGVTEVAALSGEGRLLVFPLEEVNELPNGGRGVMGIKLHDGESMLGVRPVTGEIRIAAFGRSDKRTTLVIKESDLAHYRGSRARTGRKLEPYFKRIEGFEPAAPPAL